MTNPAHNLLDQLMNEVKKNLLDHQIEKMKTEILNVVDKKQENFLQDMVQICDSIYRETVDASMHAAPRRTLPLQPNLKKIGSQNLLFHAHF